MAAPTNFGFIQGSIVLPFIAAAACRIGDVVFLSAAGTVNKSTTAGDYAARVGLVVGSEKHGLLQETTEIGDAMVAANDIVYVCVYGPAYGISEDGSTLGDKLMSGTTTAGSVKTGTTQGQVIGMALETVLTTAVFKVFVRPE